MLNRKVLIGLMLFVVLAGITTKLIYDDRMAQQRASAALQSVIQGKVKPSDIDYKTLGKYGPFVKDVSETMVKFMADAKQLEAKVQQPEFQQILDPKYLASPTDGKAQVKVIADTLKTSEGVLKQDLEQFAQSFGRAPLSTKDKEQIGKMVQDKKNEIARQLDATFKLTGNLTSKADALYDFLLSKQGTYTVQGNQVQFTSQADVDAYNKLITDIQHVADEAKK